MLVLVSIPIESDLTSLLFVMLLLLMPLLVAFVVIDDDDDDASVFVEVGVGVTTASGGDNDWNGDDVVDGTDDGAGVHVHDGRIAIG
jgi:hypothetical protein